MEHIYRDKMKIIFATGNPNKVREASEILGKSFTLIMPKELGYSGEIPETGDTIEANSLEKCKFLWDKFGKTCFADDTALEVNALNGEPGVYSARYAGPGKDPSDNTLKLLENLKGKSDRTARFRTVITLINKGTIYTFEGVLNGRIALEESGKGGFGYDPVFIPDGFSKTLAEITEEEKNAISHRGIVMRKLSDFMNKVL